MKTVVYDGTFEGLLTAIYEAYYSAEKVETIVAQYDAGPDLFAHYYPVLSDMAKAEKVASAISEKITQDSLQHIYYAFLSEQEDASNAIYYYVQFGFKVGNTINQYLTDKRVAKIEELSQKVSRERHRMLGLLRFREIAPDIYYAPIEPDYNIIELLAPHFARRMADQRWIIHDIRRSTAAGYNTQKWVVSSVEPKSMLQQTNEDNMEELWRAYFDSTTIRERINPRLQRRCMPKRYWKYLPEKSME